MKFSTISIILVLLFFQHPGFGGEQDYPEEDSILVGKVSRSELQSGGFGEIFKKEYRDYEPDQKVLDQIGDKLYYYDIIVILGTWCSDSQLQVPRFFKIIDLLNYDTRNVTIYAVDKEKKCGDIDLANLDVELVPTIIFLKKSNEKGRIIESPEQTLEKDLLRILID